MAATGISETLRLIARMIASVVAILDKDRRPIRQVLDEIARLPDVEVGEAVHSLRVPIMIDSQNPRALEETTTAIQQCDGVAFVDVVFVHLEVESADCPASPPLGTKQK